ncbi:MAG TPA: response regulator, partial [Acidimicrobiales bacterium]|nr:response regulator [Acidimicrobiales bacterium]
MPLQGTFDVLDFSAVLEILALHSMTGRLHVRSRSFAANLFFADGQIVGADQSEHQAAAVAGDVTQRAREICFELLDTDRGNFEFHPGKPNAVLGNTIMTVAQALEDARQRLTEWQELQVLIPSLDVQPRLVTELDPGQVTLDREQWRVLTAVDGRRNLRSIGRMLNMSDFEVCRAMRELLTAKVIEFDMRPAGMAAINEIDIPATEQVTI